MTWGESQQYAAIPDRIEARLAERDLADDMRQTNGEYCDRFVDPERAADHLVVEATRVAGASGA